MRWQNNVLRSWRMRITFRNCGDRGLMRGELRLGVSEGWLIEVDIRARGQRLFEEVVVYDL
jgi:hypothetical protein